MANQPDIIVVNMRDKKAVVVDDVIPTESNIRMKECEKLNKYQGVKEELDRMWSVKPLVVPVMIGLVISKVGGWLQQIPGITPETSVQKRQEDIEDMSLKETQNYPQRVSGNFILPF